MTRHRRCGRAPALLLAAVIAPLAACATGSGPESGAPEIGAAPDPIEGANRAIFGFNEGVDRFVLDPLATGWRFITPQAFRLHLGKAFDNLEFPMRFVSNLGQGAVGQAGREVGRFAVNSTVGLLGFFDPATGWGMPASEEDIGQMFGRWGVPPGPYLVVPLLGPSNPRDFVGGVADGVLDLLPAFGRPVEIVNTRALFDRDIDLAREAALDYYVFVRDAYTTRRRLLVENRDAPQLYALPEDEVGDALYEIADDLETEPAGDAGGTAPGGDPDADAGGPGAPETGGASR